MTRASLMCPSHSIPDMGSEPSELELAILELLEEAGLSTEINDQIMMLVERGQREIFNSEDGSV